MHHRTLLLSFLTLFFVVQHGAVADTLQALPKSPPIPKDNPMSPGKIALGKQLYFDPRISKDGTVSCNSCHNLMSSGEDNRPNSVGVSGKKGGRTSPTVWNAAFMTVMFWDGRMNTLEDQAKGPMTNPVEMAMESHQIVEQRIRDIPEYAAQFKKVFGEKGLTIDTIAKAIAAYERTLITPNSAFDKYIKGNKNALSPLAKRGLTIVQEKGCLNCHGGPNFSGETPIGEGRFVKFPLLEGTDYEKQYHLTDDLGRFEVTKDEGDRNVWRVPTWRNVALTAPYFHNGSVKTLDEAVRVMVKVQLGSSLEEEEVKAVVAFLESLTGEFPVQTMPRLPQTPGRVLAGIE